MAVGAAAALLLCCCCWKSVATATGYPWENLPETNYASEASQLCFLAFFPLLLILILKFELEAKGKNCLPSNCHITRQQETQEEPRGPQTGSGFCCCCPWGQRNWISQAKSALERRTNAPATEKPQNPKSNSSRANANCSNNNTTATTTATRVATNQASGAFPSAIIPCFDCGK